jgi:hypothetical protein
MTPSSDFDRLVASWLETSGPAVIRAEVVEDALTSARGTRRRAGLVALLSGPAPWPQYGRRTSFRGLPTAFRIALLLAAAVVALVGAAIAGGRLLQPMPQLEQRAFPRPISATASPTSAARAASSQAGPAILPGEPWIAYVGAAPVQSLNLVRPDGSGDHRIAADVAAIVSEPAWLPDAGSIVFVSRDNGRAGVILEVGADGSHAVQLLDGATACPGGLNGPSPSSDGRRLAFVCRSDATTSSVRVLQLSNGAVATVATVLAPEEFANAPSWSPDGSLLAVDVVTRKPNDPTLLSGSLVATVGSGGGPVTSLTASLDFASYPDWDPVGDRLAFGTFDIGTVPVGTPASEIFTVRPDGSDPAQITEDGRIRYGEARWNPDGSSLVGVMLAGHAPKPQLASIDARTGDFTVLGPFGWEPDPRPVP